MEGPQALSFVGHAEKYIGTGVSIHMKRPPERLYATDLAYIHHAGFGDFARRAAPELIRILRAHGIRNGFIVEAGKRHRLPTMLHTSFFVEQGGLASYAATGEPSVPMIEMRQGTRMGWGIYQPFTAADEAQVFIGITSNAHWERFCKEFALDDLLADESLNDNARRVAARGRLPQRIGEEMRRYPSAELAERIERARVPFAPLRRPDQLVDDPHLNEARQFVETPLPGRGVAKLPEMPVRSSAFEFTLRRPARTRSHNPRFHAKSAPAAARNVGRRTECARTSSRRRNARSAETKNVGSRSAAPGDRRMDRDAAVGAAIIGSFGITMVLSQDYLPRHIGMASGLSIGFSIAPANP